MATDAMTDSFRIYLQSCSDEMATEIISLLQQTGKRAVPYAAFGMTTSGSAVTKTEKKQRKKAKAVETGGPKRPLNSWMAFRKYYNRVLSSHTQKAISKCLNQMWRAELFSAKWALLAKAYSIVRGNNEKKDAPLDDFFAICAPLIGIIPPEIYLESMGWQLLPPLVGDPEKVPQLMRIFEPTLDSFDEEHTTTNFGVADLVKACFDAGYGKQNIIGPQNVSTHGALTMASRPTNIPSDGMSEVMNMAALAQTDASLGSAGMGSNTVMDNNIHQTLVNAPLLSTVDFDPSPLASARTASQEILDQAYSTLQSTGWEFGLVNGAQLEQSFDPNASNEDHWDAQDLNSIIVPSDGVVFDINEWLNVNGQ